jgi:UDP-N-acetylmuramoylalanine--D-glutamate ligase
MATSTTNTDSKNYIKPGMTILVVGLGKTGMAAVKFFLQHGAHVSVSDSSPRGTILPEILAWLEKNNIPCETGGHSIDLFTSADLIFVSPGIPLSIEPLVEARHNSIPVLGELAIAAHYLKTPAVGITGTNGKTTVTTLLGDILQASFQNVFVGGNIGTPILEYVAGPQDGDVVVAEISSFQIDSGGGANGLPYKVAILLNISPDHLERYTSFSAYVDSKFNIFAAQNPDDFSILNADDTEIMNRKHLWPKNQKFFFGKELADLAGATIHNDKIILKSSSDSALPDSMHGEEYDLARTSLKQSPNKQNAAAAILAARLMGCQRQDILKGLFAFEPLNNIISVVAEINGVNFINDSKATNVGAVYSALESIKRPIILIAGGRDKGGDYSLLSEPIRQKVKHILLIGEARDQMNRAFLAFTNVETLDSLQDAVSKAANLAEPGDAVLLSPACASFDMFSSYAERGDVFKNSVLSIKNNSADKTKEDLSQ